MKKSLIATLAVASLLFGHVPAAAAETHTSSAGWCAERQPDTEKYYYKHGKHWDCVVPGAWCAKKQYGQYGYSMRHAAHTKRYKCVRYASGRWHWKAAA
ncbi:hypothetical protein AB0J63_42685 [Streptosporangium canum]|uniref:hypothetical protein n=1 Tax=Streptosporangium canum TaxID=324952 RepID=UPI0034239780